MSAGSGVSLPSPPSSPGATGSPPLLRKGIPGEKKPLREKLITYYEAIFTVRQVERRLRHYVLKLCINIFELGTPDYEL